MPATFCPSPLAPWQMEALGLVHLFPAFEVVTLRRLRHLRVAAASTLDANRRLARQPVGIDRQGCHLRAVGRRWLAVHAELKAALDALGEGVDLVVFLAIGRVHGIRAPQRRRVAQAALVEVTVAAVKAVADVVRHQPTCVDKQGVAIADHLAVGVVGQFAFCRRGKARRGSWRGLELRLVFHGNRRSMDTAKGQGQGSENHRLHGLTSGLTGLAK